MPKPQQALRACEQGGNPAPTSTPLPVQTVAWYPRYEFTAAAEVVPALIRSRMETRVADLSQQGCYVDTATFFL